jgi:hypothetical protein
MWSEKREAKTVEVESLANNHSVLPCVLYRNRRHCGKLTGKDREQYCYPGGLFFPLLPQHAYSCASDLS